jgi:hypothetical protein
VHIGDQDIDAVYLDRFFIIHWLIQSHPQTGTSSAGALDENTKVLPLFLSLQLFYFVAG